MPFNIYITPSGSSGQPSYGWQVQAEPAVADAIHATVSNGSLALDFDKYGLGDATWEQHVFKQDQPIKVGPGQQLNAPPAL